MTLSNILGAPAPPSMNSRGQSPAEPAQSLRPALGMLTVDSVTTQTEVKHQPPGEDNLEYCSMLAYFMM